MVMAFVNVLNLLERFLYSQFWDLTLNLNFEGENSLSPLGNCVGTHADSSSEVSSICLKLAVGFKYFN